MEREIKRMVRKARASWWDDGIVEMVSGGSLVVIGGVGLLVSRFPDSLFFKLVWILVLFGLILGGKRVVRWLKSRYVWPEYGYAEPSRKGGAGSLVWVVVAMVALFLSVILFEHPVANFLISLVPFCIFLSVAQYAGLNRFVVFGFLTLLAGIGLAFLRVKFNDAVSIELLFAGGVLIVSGIFRWSSLKRRAKVDGQ